MIKRGRVHSAFHRSDGHTSSAAAIAIRALARALGASAPSNETRNASPRIPRASAPPSLALLDDVGERAAADGARQRAGVAGAGPRFRADPGGAIPRNVKAPRGNSRAARWPIAAADASAAAAAATTAILIECVGAGLVLVGGPSLASSCAF